MASSVNDGDIDLNLPTETIRQRIREEYLRDTLIVVLIGAQTWQRKHIDWEIGSSIRDTKANPRSGLLPILLPTYPRADKSKYSPRTIPPRLHDNIECGFASIHNWSEDVATVHDWIHQAYLRKSSKQPDNSRASFVKKRIGDAWTDWSMRTPYEIRLQGGRVLKTTPVFDTYWRFASERQEMFMRRVTGLTPPWTEDPILSAYRFTNAYRASDRVSQYLIRHVIYEGSQKPEEVFFRTVLFKLFNRIGTWEALRAEMGALSWQEFTFDAYAQVLDRLLDDGQRIYSAAYIMPSPAFGSPRKHRNHLRLVERMMADGAARRIAKTTSLREVFNLIRGYRSLGDFLAFQFAIDLNYSELTDFSEMEFVVAGPGARDGIRKCFDRRGGLDGGRGHPGHGRARGRRVRSLGIEFQACGVGSCSSSTARTCSARSASTRASLTRKSKAIRANPHQAEVHATSGTDPQWYPPKWGLTVNVPAPKPSGEASTAPRRRCAKAGEDAARP